MQHVAHHPFHTLLQRAKQRLPGVDMGTPDGALRDAGGAVTKFRNAFWLCLLLTLPTLLWDPVLQQQLGYQLPDYSGMQLLPLVFGVALFLYGGQIFINAAYREVRARRPGMMLLIAVAITVVFIHTLIGSGQGGWWTLAILLTFILLGYWIAFTVIHRLQDGLKETARQLPERAWRLGDDGQLSEVALSELAVGEQLVILPGAVVPADGAVLDGESMLDEMRCCGVLGPTGKHAGSTVYAGSINGGGRLHVAITALGEQTSLARTLALVEQMQDSHSALQGSTERAAVGLTIFAMAAALVTVAGWLVAGSSLDISLTHMVAVLVIACPLALGLAVPLVFAIATPMAARQGLLVRARRGLEEAHKIDLVVFDKTGTLTSGVPRAVATRTSGALTAEQALQLAAAVERESSHPVAQALCLSAASLAQQFATQVRSLSGCGVEGVVDGHQVMVGGEVLLSQRHVALSAPLATATREFNEAGFSTTYLFLDGEVAAVFAMADAPRAEAQEAVRRLHQRGIGVALLTADSQAASERLARDLGIEMVLAQVLPGQKMETIRELQGYGKRVAMVGDGDSDAAALQRADVGIAIGGNEDVNAGDVVLLHADPCDVDRVIVLSKAVSRKVVENIGLAVGYNIVALLLASGVIVAMGEVVLPALAALLMTAGMVIVALNTLRLRRLVL